MATITFPIEFHKYLETPRNKRQWNIFSENITDIVNEYNHPNIYISPLPNSFLAIAYINSFLIILFSFIFLITKLLFLKKKK